MTIKVAMERMTYKSNKVEGIKLVSGWKKQGGECGDCVMTRLHKREGRGSAR